VSAKEGKRGPGSGAKTIAADFHTLYYNNADQTLRRTRWLGNRVIKCPLDLWIYQEIIWDIRPGLIIETGSGRGGSAYFMACMCDLAGHGRIVTVDVRDVERPPHDRVTYLQGSSVEPAVLERMRAEAEGEDAVMVLLDSDHSKEHVLAELAEYARLVTPGSYLIVEDTNVNGHPVVPDHGPGPMEAVHEFLASEAGAEFAIDEDAEKFFLTMNPSGYLRRSGGKRR
jgi:cephalosporin hydroxylase